MLFSWFSVFPLFADNDLLIQLVPSLGQSAALLVALWYFLNHLANKDRQEQEALGRLVDRMEAVSKANETAVQNMSGTVFSLSREMVQSVSHLNETVNELNHSVMEKRHVVAELNSILGAMRASGRKQSSEG